MNENCIFCRIVNGSEPAYVVYSDSKVIAFLDKYPIKKGHTLVITREHYRDFLSTPTEVIGYLSEVTKKVASAVMDALNADGVKIFTNVGSSAGQVIFHVHIHVLPTWENEPPFSARRKEIDRETAERISSAIREKVSTLN